MLSKLQLNRQSYAAVWRVPTNDSAFCPITLVLVSILCLLLYRKWQLERGEFDLLDGDNADGMTGEVGSIERERYLMERAKETAETSHVTTSEQEETSSYVITGD